MEYIVTVKQHNSKKCLVCGLKNDLGLKASFYELDNGELAALFTPVDEHQSYPGRLHGGVSAAILDETIGRAILTRDRDAWGVTVELKLEYKKPVPLNEELKVIGRITKDSKRIFEGTGEIVLPNGDIAVTACGKYIKMPIDKIADFDEQDEEWKVELTDKDPVKIDI